MDPFAPPGDVPTLGHGDPAPITPPPIVAPPPVPPPLPPAAGGPPADGMRRSAAARRRRPSLVKRGIAALRDSFAAQAEAARAAAAARVAAGHTGRQSGFQRLVGATPPWLVSVVVHATLVLMIGLIAVEAHQEATEEMAISLAEPPPFTDEDVFAETLGQQLDVPNDIPSDQIVENIDSTFANSPLPEVDDPLSAPPPALGDITGEGTSFFSDIDASAIGNNLSGRQEGRKEALLGAYGGTRTTQESVGFALAWLVRQQQRDGSWSLVGPYPHGAGGENRPAATAMAMLAFLGDGHTHIKEGPFQRTVNRGIKALLKFQREDGSFGDEDVRAHEQLYTHAQCTIALCELYALTESSELRDPAIKAIDYCVKIQAPGGGWRYFPMQDADTSVTGWFVMALQSARMAKLEVPSETFVRVAQFLDSVATHSGSRYSYQPGRVDTPAMTAEATLCRQYMGWPKSDKRMIASVNYLGNHPVDWDQRDVYYWYYATQVMHHMGGEPWVKWNKVMRQVLPENQVRTGKDRGSWNPQEDQWGRTAGRLYTTCLSTYMLEVYYRHLPLYKNTGEEAAVAKQ